MSQKPPAFQFYSKDWRSSQTIHKMTRQDLGDYITLLAASWESDEPGTLPLPIEIAAKCAGSDPRVVRNFLRKYPSTFVQLDGHLVNHKLHDQWLELQERKQKQSDAGKKGNEKRWNLQSGGDSQPASGGDRSASASASALSTSTTPPIILPPQLEPEKPKTPKFIRPTESEVASYMTEKQFLNPSETASKFMSYYESNGWKVGKNPMKSWKGAVSGTWQTNQNSGGNGNGRPPRQLDPEDIEALELAERLHREHRTTL